VVQVGSFSQAESAGKLAAKLHARGFPVYTQYQPNHFVRVYVGPLPSQQQALRASQQIQSEFQLHSLVTKTHA
jgi:cell division septation protein DedD